MDCKLMIQSQSVSLYRPWPTCTTGHWLEWC